MKKTTIAVLVFVPAALLSSCSVRTTTYAPGYYNRDYVSVGVGVRPVRTVGFGVNTVGFGVGPGYWNDGYYRDVGYWRGYRGYSNVGFWGARW